MYQIDDPKVDRRIHDKLSGSRWYTVKEKQDPIPAVSGLHHPLRIDQEFSPAEFNPYNLFRHLLLYNLYCELYSSIIIKVTLLELHNVTSGVQAN